MQNFRQPLTFSNPLPDVSAKEWKQVKGSLLIQLPKLCSIAKATNNGSQGCEKPFFYWVGQKTILLQTLAKNRVSAFLYLPLLSVPEIWKGELYIESQKCNNITILNQTKAQKFNIFQLEFLLFFSTSPIQNCKRWSFSFCLKIAQFQIRLRAPVESL